MFVIKKKGKRDEILMEIIHLIIQIVLKTLKGVSAGWLRQRSPCRRRHAGHSSTSINHEFVPEGNLEIILLLPFSHSLHLAMLVSKDVLFIWVYTEEALNFTRAPSNAFAHSNVPQSQANKAPGRTTGMGDMKIVASAWNIKESSSSCHLISTT